MPSEDSFHSNSALDPTPPTNDVSTPPNQSPDDGGNAAGEQTETTTFRSLGLPPDLLRSVEDAGYVAPTPIQERTIPVLLQGRDVLGVAQTGTGKTAAFGLPLLASIDPSKRTTQALVLAPTRELAVQVADAISGFAQASSNVSVLAIYGGASYVPQLRGLKDGAQVVVGTPGRVTDHISRGTLQLSDVGFFVLDEADEMLRMGFAEEVEDIASHVPTTRRTALFSATMPAAIRKVSAAHLTDPVHVSVTPPASTVSTVDQQYAVVPFRHKTGALARVLAVSDATAAIVFVRTKAQVEEVAIELAAKSVRAAALSGDVPQRERERLVERLRTGTLDVLVATDVAARGLDVERVELVVNYDVPRETDSYVHRIGRTGRAGRSGTALTFLTPKEKGRLKTIERATGATLTQASIPTPADVSKHRAARLLDQVSARHDQGRLEAYKELLSEAMGNTIPADPVEIAAALMALAVGDEGPRPHGADGARGIPEEDFTQASFDDGPGRPGKSKGRRAARAADAQATRYRIDVGHKDGVRPGSIVGALTGESFLSGGDIGRIDIFPSFTLVDILPDLDGRTESKLARAQIAGRQLRLREDAGPKHAGAPRTAKRRLNGPSASGGTRPRHSKR